MIPINPIGMGMKDWCDQMTTNLAQYGAFRRLMDESEWGAWSLYVYPFLQKHKAQTPDPRGMPWREWAVRVNGVLAG